ncbi:MAG: glycoside hydrolase family 88 protein [Acidobacteriota bacterium]|nr:MAG: glycoside hydrolase family 88 protein [Acidobacteriota bacterium]
MIRTNEKITARDLSLSTRRLWQVSGPKIAEINRTFDLSTGSPVYTVGGQYQAQGWTDWTLGFHFGSALLQFEATGDEEFLQIGRQGLGRMEAHLTHMGVHDHGFNTVSTFGNLRRMIRDGRVVEQEGELRYLELAIKCSAAVQARRWSRYRDGGYIYSFNGPHSLFADTIRSLRILSLGYLLGHLLFEENDQPVSLLERLIQHARASADFSVYYGAGRDAYDVRGRVAHESIFNMNDGNYRCPSTQQGYSSRSTWTRGLAWIILGFAEQLEFLSALPSDDLKPFGGRSEVLGWMQRAAEASADYYIESSPTNGIPYWDTGAPGLAQIKDHLENPADPFNEFEPVDSSAAAIAAQGLLRLGHYLKENQQQESGNQYWQVGLTVAAALFDSPYLSESPDHQGLLLHSLYHRPNGWDAIPPGRKVPCNESSMWGDYHVRELAIYLDKIALKDRYLTFWNAKETDI